jgi:CHAT domain-containing protein/Flp pilus assembly protein TadD
MQTPTPNSRFLILTFVFSFQILYSFQIPNLLRRCDFKLFIFAFVFSFQILYSFQIPHLQAQPQNPNLTENGKRQGAWTILLNAKKGKVDSVKNATYYRLITYRDGKPTGITIDYYLNGKRQMQGKLLAEGLAPKYEGIVTYYHPNGKKDYEEKYENGKAVGKIYFNRDGSVVKEDWEKLHDEAMKKYFVAENYIKALDMVKKGNKAAKMQFGNKHQIYTSCLINEGNIYVKQQKYRQAEKVLQKALQLKIKLLGKEHEDYIAALVSIGTLYFNQGQISKAQPLFEEALNIGRVKYKTYNPLAYAVSLNNSAIIALSTGKYAQADTLFTEASQIFEKVSKTAYAIALNNLATVYYYQAQYPKADSTARLSLKIQEGEKNQESSHYAYTLNNLYVTYVKQGRYLQADSLLSLAGKIFEKTGTNNPYYLSFTTNLIGRYVIKAQYKKADSLYAEVSKIQEKTIGKQHPDYASVLNNWGYTYISQSKFKRGEEKLVEAKTIFEKTNNQAHTNYVATLRNLAELYYLQGKYKQAELYFFKAKEILEESGRTLTDEYISLLNSLANYYGYQGKFEKEKELRLKNLTLAQSLMGENHPEYATYLRTSADMYENQGDYTKTDSLYQVVARIIRHTYGGENHIEYAFLLTKWGTSYYNQRNYTQAENLYQQAIQIYKDTQNENEPNYLYLLQSLAILYKEQGEYKKAEEFILKTLKIAEENVGKDNDIYAGCLLVLANLSETQENYGKALSLHEQIITILKNTTGEKSPSYINNLSSLARVYIQQKKYTKADSLYPQITTFYKEIYGEKHFNYGASLGNWASSFHRQKKYDRAEELYLQALEIIRKAKGENHPDYATYANALAIVYDDQLKFEQASPLYLKMTAIKVEEIQNNLSNLSESGKQKYLKDNQYFLSNLHGFIAHLLEKQPNNKDLPRLCQAAFDIQLRTKGLLLSETQKMKNRILGSKDSVLIRQMEIWQAKKNFIAKVYNMTTAERKKRKLDLSTLENEANELEKQLATRSADFQYAFNPPIYTSQDLQKKLGENDIAIEMIKGSRINWEKENPDTTSYYLALILTQKGITPVLMTNGKAMEDSIFDAYQRSTRELNPDKGVYEAYWGEIAKALEKVAPSQQWENTSSPQPTSKGTAASPLPPSKGAKSENAILSPPLEGAGGRLPLKIYFSPDGIYNTLNLNTLLNPSTEKYLLEEYDIQIVTNLKDIFANQRVQTSKTASLFGNPRYRMDKQAYEKSIEGLRGGGREGQFAKVATEKRWSILPNTETEVIGIDSVLKANQWQTEVFLWEQAIEERVKRVQNPSILHLATHGYFTPTDAKNSASGMVNSGVVLAGVNTLERGENTDDGVLTALEASTLHLDHTDLVVLSACETGLGEASIGEGVYGLQRGFKVAGAKAVLMSLWAVNDLITQKLMNTFYELWLSGTPKREAFKQAQAIIKAKHPIPRYWGAFVIVGD